jgi:hypothetical protein
LWAERKVFTSLETTNAVIMDAHMAAATSRSVNHHDLHTAATCLIDTERKYLQYIIVGKLWRVTPCRVLCAMRLESSNLPKIPKSRNSNIGIAMQGVE